MRLAVRSGGLAKITWTRERPRMAPNKHLIESGGTCPTCGRTCGALADFAERLGTLVPTASAEVNMLAADSTVGLAEMFIARLTKRVRELGRAARCYAGTCGDDPAVRG